MSTKASLLTILSLFIACSIQAQGTIQLGNSVGTPIRWVGPDGLAGRTVTLADQVYLTIWFANPGEELVQAAINPIQVVNNGLLGGGSYSVFQLPGTEGGQTVSLQIRAYQNDPLCQVGATRVAQVTLGPTAGPGTVIWQSATGTNPNRFTALLLYPCPEPSTIALGMLGLAGLFLVRRRM
jgi:hypothetical protein